MTGPDNALWGPDWREVRALWSLDPARAHLNHGSFGAVPIPVQRAQEELRRRVEANPMRELTRTMTDGLEKARSRAASFLGADLEGFVFVPNATTGINTVLAALELRPGEEVLVTDHTYGAVRFTVERACALARAAAVVQPVPIPRRGANELCDAVLAGVTQRTRLAIVDHIASPTALVFPIAKLVPELRRRGVMVMVDGAHAPGMFDLDLAALDPDFWTGNFHKWCCSPRGSAGLWVRAEHRSSIAPIVTSWYVAEGYPASFRWAGTDDYTPYATVPAALDFMAGLGWDRVRAHNRALSRYGRDVVQAALATEPPVDPSLDELFEAMTLLRLPDGVATTEDEASELRLRISEELGIEALPVAWCGRGFLRLSAQAYNAPGDYEQLAEGLPGLLGLSR